MRYTTTILFGVSLAVVAGLFGSGIFGITMTKADQTNLGTTGLITGHVTTTLLDSEGNIKEYRQTDNMIVNQGENCVSKLLFANTTTGTSVCVGARQDGFRYIGIGNNSAAIALDDDNIRLGNELNNTSYGNNVVSGDTLLRQPATVSASGWTNSTGSTSPTSAQIVMSALFKNKNAVGGSSVLVTESGLFNNTDKAPTTSSFRSIVNQDAMFARQTFSAITMAPGDSLTVQWTINVGGTNTLT